MHPCSLYLALCLHFTLVWFSSGFPCALKQVTQGRPKGSFVHLLIHAMLYFKKVQPHIDVNGGTHEI